MLFSKLLDRFPKSFLWRMTVLNILITTLFIGLSSWAVYQTACMLVEDTQSTERASAFRVALRQDLWVFGILAVVTGSLLHLKSNRKLTWPLHELIRTTKALKSGMSPGPVNVHASGDMQQLIHHFNELMDQLDRNRQQQKKLVSDLSHEIRTPLSNIDGYLDALRSGVMEGSPELYAALHKESQRLIHLVEQLDRLTEWDEARHQHFLVKEPVSVRDVVDQSTAMFRWTFQNRKITCETDVEETVLHLDPAGMSQVLSNLIDNAIRYYAGEGPIRIIGQRDGEQYSLTVTGPGLPIPDEDRKELFTRFHRVERSRHRETGGLGLGLAISSEIVEKHGGTLTLSSEGNEHSFRMVLPL